MKPNYSLCKQVDCRKLSIVVAVVYSGGIAVETGFGVGVVIIGTGSGVGVILGVGVGTVV